ncbi:MAG: hypothetical protein K2X93_06120 [Candidatus Obscuribacterales bacterium]|nr:hypothetical protein [Candidatus Obscuribacterales bacterium]
MRIIKSTLDRFRQPQRRKSAQAVIDSIQIASPCPVDWESMDGDERKRFCGQCQLHVYNLKEMTAQEAVDLIAEGEGRVCVQLFRRKDGTVLTQDCPTGLARLRRAMWRRVACLAAAIGWLSLATAAGAKSMDPNPEQNQLRGEVIGGKPRCEIVKGRMKVVPSTTQPQTFPAEVQGTNLTSACAEPPTNYGMVLWRAILSGAAMGLVVASFRLQKKRRTLWILGLSMAAVFGLLGFSWL